MNRRILRAVLMLLALSAGLAACGGSSSSSKTQSPPGAGTAITIHSFAFHPNTLPAKVGDVVTVRNDDGVNHTLTAIDGTFDTGAFSAGSKTIALSRAGTFAYHCNIHHFMTGTIQVNA